MKRLFVVVAIATFLVGCVPPKHVPVIVNMAELSAPPPVYPPEAVHLKEEGTVLLLVLVGKDGLAKDIKVSQTSGFPLLDKEAIRTVSHWTFRPKTIDGVPVYGYAGIPVSFNLNKI